MNFSTQLSVSLLCWAVVGLFVWCLISWKLVTNSLFNPYVLFFIAITLFNAGQAFLQIINVNEYGILAGMFSDQTIAKSLLLTLLCMYVMQLFALMTLFFVIGSQMEKNGAPVSDHSASLRFTGILLLAVAIFPTMNQWVSSVQVVLQSGYMGLYSGEAATGASNINALLASFLTPAIMFLLAGSKDKKWSLYLSLILLVISSSILFFLGYRAIAVMPVAAYFWLYDQRIKKINRAVLLTFSAVFLLVLFPLIRAIRSTTGEDKFSAGFIKDTYLSIENPLFGIINEMGNSMFTLAHTIQLFPDVRNFDYGTSYLYAPLTFFPNFFWDIHPSMEHTYSNWLVWTVDPKVAARGGGYGFSAIAEGFANFGWLAPLVMGIVATFLVITYTKSLHDPAKLAFTASFLSFFFIFARGESIFVARTLLWYALIPYCLFLFVQSVFRYKNAGVIKPRLRNTE